MKGRDLDILSIYQYSREVKECYWYLPPVECEYETGGKGGRTRLAARRVGIRKRKCRKCRVRKVSKMVSRGCSPKQDTHAQRIFFGHTDKTRTCKEVHEGEVTDLALSEWPGQVVPSFLDTRVVIHPAKRNTTRTYEWPETNSNGQSTSSTRTLSISLSNIAGVISSTRTVIKLSGATLLYAATPPELGVSNSAPNGCLSRART